MPSCFADARHERFARRVKSFSVALLVSLSLGGCAGYHIGDVKPHYLEGVRTIAVPTFRNETYQPRMEVLMTNTVIKQLQQDGTFQITTEDKADAVLRGRSMASRASRSDRFAETCWPRRNSISPWEFVTL